MPVTSGTVNTNVVSKSNFYVAWSQVSQDVANNQTRINWVAGIYTGTSSSHDMFYSNAVKIYSVYINGTQVSNGGTWSNIKTGGKHDLLSGTIDIPHNADGSKSFNISISAWTYPGSNYSGDGWFELTSIPRQATVTGGTDFTDEQNPTVYYSNPAGNAVSSLQAYIEDTNAHILVGLRDIPKTGTGYTFPLTAAERNTLRNAIPNSKTLTVRMVVRTIIGGNTFFSWVTKTMTIVNAEPYISMISYRDINTAITDITEDDELIVQNQSTLQFQFYDVQAYKGASLSKLRINLNGHIREVTFAGTAITATTYRYGEVDVSSNTTAVLTIIDTRGFSRNYNVPIRILEYSNPSALITVNRLSNFYSQCFLTVDARYSSLDNKNTIDIKYRLKKSEEENWGNWIQLQDNVQVTFTADNQYAWDLQIQLEDIIGSLITYNMPKAIDVGIPLVFYDLKNRSVGVNTMPQESGSFEVTGPLILNGKNIEPVTLYYNVNGSNTNITLSDNSANYSYLEVFYFNGDMYGSIKIDTVKNKGTITLTNDYNNLNIFQIKTMPITANGTTLQRGTESYLNLVYDGTNVINRGTESGIYIYKVLGYQ